MVSVVGAAGSTAGPASWESLSDQQWKVARLVSQALTDRQIARRLALSPHTVNYHLRQIFRKLGIGSRVELARAVQERLSQRAGHDG